MKRILYFFGAALVAALCALSCTQEIEGNGLDSREKARQQRSSQEILITATAPDAEPETKTARFDTKFYWAVGDQISLFYGPGDQGGSCFTSTHTIQDGDDGHEGYVRRTTFRGYIEVITGLAEGSDDIKFWGIFPYRNDNACVDDGAAVVTTINSVQNTNYDSWGNDQSVCIGRSDGLVMGFYNLCGGIMFKLSQDRMLDRITFRGNNNETVAGQVKVVMDSKNEPVISEFITQEKEITLYAPNAFIPSGATTGDIWYYLILPPCTFSKGFTITLYDFDGQYAEFVESRSRTVKRNVFGKYGTAIDDGLTFTDLPPADNQIIYYAPSEADLYEFNGGNNPGHENDYTQTFSDGRGIITRTDGQDITEIPAHAFCYSEDITSVILPETVTTIGSGAFAGTALTGFTIPESVTTLGVNPFADCQSLTSFSGKFACDEGKFLIKDGCLVSAAPGAFDTNTYCVIPEGVITIGKSALAYVTAKRFLLAESITTLEDYCFRECKEGQKNVYFVLPESVTSIGSKAFEEADINPIWCSNDNLPTIQSDSFGTANDENTTFLICITGYATFASNDLLANAGPWFYYRAATNSRLRVGQDTDEIWYHLDGNGSMGFDSNLNFGSTSHPAYATGTSCVFYTGDNCSYFKPSPAVQIPFDLTSSKAIGVQLFTADVTNIPANAFRNDSFIDYISIFYAETIGDYAFFGNSSLLCFPVSRSQTYRLTSIGQYAFTNCSSMAFLNRNFIDLRNVTSLGVHAFSGCESFGTENPQQMGSILLLGQVPTIPNYAFDGCKKLTHIEICNDGFTDDAVACITSIGGQAFGGCENLMAINSESLAGGVDVINLPGVTSLAFAAFYGCASITDVTLGAVPKISNDAFHGCTALVNVTLDTQTLTTIEDLAFYNCPKLKNVKSSTETLTGIFLPKVTAVGTSAFANSGTADGGVFDYVQIGNGVATGVDVTLGASAFANCKYLNTVVLPTTTTLSANCFWNCTRLTSALVNKVTLVQQQAFYGCTALTKLNLPAVTIIGDKAFGQTRSLTELEFGPGLTTLGAMIFYDESTDNTVRNYDKLEITFSGAYPTSLYSAWDGTTPTFAYTDDAQNLFMPKKVYVPEDFYDDYHSGFADDWDQWISEHRLQMYRPE